MITLKAGIITAAFFAVIANACDRSVDSPSAGATSGPRPEVLPVILNRELPFRYPSALYSQKVQGNVTLRLFIDGDGQVVSDSTRVVETSGYTALDSAAVKGSLDLKFVPAKRAGGPMAVSILFPVYFRHPDAPPLPGDTILKTSGGM